MSPKGAVTATFTCNKLPLPQDYELHHLEIVAEANRIPLAEVAFSDGSVASREFALSNSDHFAPGSEVAIKLRYEGQRDHTVFTGIVVRHRIGMTRTGSLLTLTLKDKAAKMASVPRTQVYRKKTDTDIFKALIGAAELKAGKLPVTTLQHEEMVKLSCSDWDFLLARAEAMGHWVLARNGTIDIINPEPDPGPLAEHRFQLGVDTVLAFDMEVDIRAQTKKLTARTWDLSQQKLGKQEEATKPRLSQGDADKVDAYAGAIGAQWKHLPGGGSLEQKEVAALANGRMRADRMGLIRGYLEIPGDGAPKPGDSIQLTRFGKRFDGFTRIAGVRHLYDKCGWTTELQIGLLPEWLTAKRDLSRPPAGALLAPIHGLHVGVVHDFEKDPRDTFRIRVAVPALGPKDNLLWARLATPEAGKERGFFFRPEKGDEVVLGFFDDDPRQPVILGAMFNPKNKPPFPLDEDNFAKGIVTRAGNTLTFNDDEDNKEVTATLAASKKFGFTLTDTKSAALKADEETLTLSCEEGIGLVTKKDMTLKADQKLTATGKSGLDLSSSDGAAKIAGTPIEAKGKNIKLKGKVAVE